MKGRGGIAVVQTQLTSKPRVPSARSASNTDGSKENSGGKSSCVRSGVTLRSSPLLPVVVVVHVLVLLVDWATEPARLPGCVEGVRGVDGVREPEFWGAFGAGLRLVLSGKQTRQYFKSFLIQTGNSCQIIVLLFT